MKKEEIYKAWIRKARSDLSVAENELKTETPEYNVICFLLQQFSEKYLKGFLVFSETAFKKSHSIEYLLSLCKQINLDFNQFYNEEFIRLSYCSVEVRYPDGQLDIDEEEIDTMLDYIYKLKNLIETLLNINH